MLTTGNYNYFDQNPQNLRDFEFANHLDQEQFALFGLPITYYKLSETPENYDPLLRDYKSSPNYSEPIQIRTFPKLDSETSHGMSDGSGQVAERTGTIFFNIALIKAQIGRDPQIGDVFFYPPDNQKFIIFELSKTEHKLGRPLRWKAMVRLYQDCI